MGMYKLAYINLQAVTYNDMHMSTDFCTRYDGLFCISEICPLLA